MSDRTPMHWARWGDPGRAPESPGTGLPEGTRELVELAFGPLRERPTLPLAEVALPAPRLAPALLAGLQDLVGVEHVATDHETRVRHTRGRSTPDLLRMRAGDGSDAPDAVVSPRGHVEVQALVSWCSEHRVALVPYGGGTSVVGGLDGPGGPAGSQAGGYAGVVALDLARLDRLLEVDPVARTAVLEAGLRGPDAEHLLSAHDLTLGHFPQSFRYATIGGFAATRSSGQASAGYGRFDAMVVGLRVATPRGTLELDSAPASAAGPDLRQLVLGSEGAFGVITSVRVQVRARPAASVHETWRFPDLTSGLAALRSLAQGAGTPTVLRLSDEAETAIDLSDLGAGSGGGCRVLVGHDGTAAEVADARARTARQLRACGGSSEGASGEAAGAHWAATRFDGPYLRDALLDVGVLVETLETATFWSRLPAVYDAVRTALTAGLADPAAGLPEPLVLCHVSHVYPTGASLYFTVAVRQAGDDLAGWLSQWRAAKAAATDAIVAHGATVTHHHAVGRDHRPWLADEIGPVGVEMLRAVKERLDPHAVMNPGVLVP